MIIGGARAPAPPLPPAVAGVAADLLVAEGVAVVLLAVVALGCAVCGATGAAGGAGGGGGDVSPVVLSPVVLERDSGLPFPVAFASGAFCPGSTAHTGERGIL